MTSHSKCEVMCMRHVELNPVAPEFAHDLSAVRCQKRLDVRQGRTSSQSTGLRGRCAAFSREAPATSLAPFREGVGAGIARRVGGRECGAAVGDKKPARGVERGAGEVL